MTSKDRSSNSGKDSPSVEERVARINSTQIIITSVISAISVTAGALIQSQVGPSENNGNDIANLRTQVAQQEETITKQRDTIDKMKNDNEVQADTLAKLYNLTADYIEGSLADTNGKSQLATTEPNFDNGDFTYKRLKRAVFENIAELQADPQILATTLELLANRGHKWVSEHSARAVAEFTKIKQLKLRWLKDKAVPQLSRAKDKMRQSPAQTSASARVILPTELWLLKPVPSKQPSYDVTNMTALQSEIDLIEKSLGNNIINR